MDDCYSRSQTSQGSSKNYPKTTTMEYGYFSTFPEQNPQMYNWNSVFIRYCDGGSFSGDNDTITDYRGTQLYFRGKRILQAVFNDLYTNRGLQNATDVVISGCSAGGLATFLHVDWWKNNLSPTTKVRGMPDSGFFLDYESPVKKYHSSMIWVFNQMNSSSGVNEDCINYYRSTGDTWKCIFAEHTSPFIQTPIFPLQSEYDEWQIYEDLNSTDPKAINAWGETLTNLVKTNLLAKPQHGIFLDSCQHHCGEWGNIVISGDNQAKAFEEWYDGGSVRFYYQNKEYPCTACCSP
eukprot:TRINITY_DN1425_c0_g3_i3.p1 TRINITY_DN1425_c0_g3~~TRINITY_DN1425_c0_g3_i3.p1  ORF type:complete len:293 (-),score=41.21 TRINITY_DN1425_c0_g3_i3:27-905(-)